MIRVDITGIAIYLEFENFVTVMVLRNALGHSVLVHIIYFYLFLHPHMFFCETIMSPHCIIWGVALLINHRAALLNY